MSKQAVILALLIGGAVSLQACSSVPQAAVEKTRGSGDVTFQAAAPGKVYVYDRTWDQVIYSAQVETGQRVRIDTFDGQVTVNGRVVVQRPIGQQDDISIYEDPTSQPVAKVRPQDSDLP